MHQPGSANPPEADQPSIGTIRGRPHSPPTPTTASTATSPAAAMTAESPSTPTGQSTLGRGAPSGTPASTVAPPSSTPAKGKEHARTETAGSSGSPARPPPGILRSHPSTTREGDRHSSYASISSSLVAGGGSYRAGPGGDLAETESLLSDDLDLGELSDTGLGYEGYFDQRERKGGRINAKGGAAKVGPAKPRPNLATTGSRSGSMTPAMRASKSRSVSRARRNSDDEDEEENEDRSRGERERAMSPAPALLGTGGADEDDEVERRDRGEELVRKRMKDRARLKKVRAWPA